MNLDALNRLASGCSACPPQRLPSALRKALSDVPGLPTCFAARSLTASRELAEQERRAMARLRGLGGAGIRR